MRKPPDPDLLRGWIASCDYAARACRATENRPRLVRDGDESGPVREGLGEAFETLAHFLRELLEPGALGR